MSSFPLVIAVLAAFTLLSATLLHLSKKVRSFNEELEAGCDACLIKPTRKEHLLTVMSSFLKPRSGSVNQVSVG